MQLMDQKHWIHNTISNETALVITLYLKQEKIVIEFRRFTKDSIIKKLDGVILISSSVIKENLFLL